jgi:hypothetical protein
MLVVRIDMFNALLTAPWLEHSPSTRKVISYYVQVIRSKHRHRTFTTKTLNRIVTAGEIGLTEES